MKRWVPFILIAIVFIISVIALVYFPISNYLDFLQGWDSAVSIVLFFATVISGVFGLTKNKEEVLEPQKQKGKQNIQNAGDMEESTIIPGRDILQSEATVVETAEKNWLETQRDIDLMNLVEETNNVLLEEQKAELYGRMHEFAKSKKMGDIQAEHEFKEFLSKIDHQNLLTEREKEQVLHSWKEDLEDHDCERTTLINLLGMKRSYQLLVIDLKQRYKYDQSRLDFEMKLARKKLDYELEQRVKVLKTERECEEKKQQIAADRRRVELELEDIEEEQKFSSIAQQAEVGLRLLAKMKEIRRLDMEETLQIQHEGEIAKMERKLKDDLADYDKQERLKEANRKTEVELMKAMSELSAEQLENTLVHGNVMVADVSKDSNPILDTGAVGTQDVHTFVRQTKQPKNESEMKTCINCGCRTDEPVRFCEYCGYEFPRNDNTVTQDHSSIVVKQTQQINSTEKRLLEVVTGKELILKKKSYLKLIIRLENSRSLLNRLLAEGFITKKEFNEGKIFAEKSQEFSLPSVSDENGFLIPNELIVKLISSDFDIEEPKRKIFLEFGKDSEVLTYLVEPLKKGVLTITIELYLETKNLAQYRKSILLRSVRKITKRQKFSLFSFQFSMVNTGNSKTIIEQGTNSIAAVNGSSVLGDGAQQINNSTVQGDIVGPGATSQKVHVEHGDFVAGDKTIRAGDRSVVVGGDLTGGKIVLGDENNTILNPDPLETAEKEKQEKIIHYLDELMHECQLLPMTPMGGDSTGDLEITLDQVYVALDTQAKRDWVDEAEKKKYLDENNLSEYTSGYEQCPVAAIEAVQNQNRMVFLGDPGSGKSTFIKKVAGMAALAWKDEQAPDQLKGRHFPVIFILRDIAPLLRSLERNATKRQEKALLAIFHKAVKKNLENYGVQDFQADFQQILKQRTCLMIFDGMDEVAQDLRPLARVWIEAVVKHYRPQKVIITCRIRSYFEEAVLKEYPVYTLAPFTRKQIQDFTLGWYRTKQDLSSKQQEDRAGDFFSRVNADKNIFEMASNPMLLTQMAVLHQRDTKLPDKRVKLYEEVVSLLLYRWQDYREIQTPISEALRALLLEGKTIRLAMEHLAFKTHRLGKGDQNSVDLPRDVAIQLLQSDEYLKNYGLAEEFLTYLDQRSGLLHGRGGRMSKPDSYTFPHRTFQEYLAGCYINRQKKTTKFKLLLKIAGEGDFWDIVYKMAIEERYHIGQDPDLAELAFQLCNQCDLETEMHQRLVYWSALLGELLGVSVIQDYDDEELDIRSGTQYLEQVKARILMLFSTSLSPLERVEAGNALSALGDPRFREDCFYLPDDEMLGFKEIPAGKFWMGCNYVYTEKPYHQCNFPYDCYMSEYPVTVGQWRSYAKAAQQELTDSWVRYNRYGNHPVVVVSWKEAVKYCEWLDGELRGNETTPEGVKTLLENGYCIQLPSEAEWEKAARGTAGLMCPYGNEFDPQKGNTADTGIGTTSTVGCFSKGISPYKCLDMSGNVWEWTRSLYQEYGKKGYDFRDGREDLNDSGARVMRGGSFFNDPGNTRAACRAWRSPGYRNDLIGYRICLSKQTQDS